MVRGVRFAVFGSTFDECYCYCVGECAISERHIKIKGQNTTTQYFVFRGGLQRERGPPPIAVPSRHIVKGKERKNVKSARNRNSNVSHC